MSDRDSGRRRLESVIPDLLKRAVEIGVEKAAEAPDNLKELVGGMRMPREMAHYILTQVDETKNGLFRVVGKEVRDFLEHTNLSGEMQKMLTTVQFEISTTIRFKPNDYGDSDERDEGRKIPKPEVKADVQMKRTPRPGDRIEGNGGNGTNASNGSNGSGIANGADDRPRDRRRGKE